MKIKGLKTVNKDVVERFEIKLDKKVVDWELDIEILINPKNGRFIATLGFTEAYTFVSEVDKSIEGIIRILEDKEKLYNLTYDKRLDGLIDVDKTRDNLLEYVRNSKGIQRFSSEYIDKAMEEIEDNINEVLVDLGPLYTESLEVLWETLFEAEILLERLPNNSDLLNSDLLVEIDDFYCRMFCEKIAPILVDFLKAEYNLI